jgi:hypothetical protein
MAWFELFKPPTTLVFRAVIMATAMAEVAVCGGSATGIVQGVVGVRVAGGSPAADHEAVPVADLEVPA